VTIIQSLRYKHLYCHPARALIFVPKRRRHNHFITVIVE